MIEATIEYPFFELNHRCRIAPLTMSEIVPEELDVDAFTLDDFCVPVERSTNRSDNVDVEMLVF
jgi:hypothetical protein